MFNQLCVIAVCADDQYSALPSFVSGPVAQHGKPPQGKGAGRGAALTQSEMRFVVGFIGLLDSRRSNHM